MLANRSIPRCTVIPEIPYRNIGEAIDWLSRAFGFTLRIRIGDHRAQMNVGDGAIVLIEGDGSSKCSVMIRVESVDAQFARATQNGARVLRPPADYPYG